MWRKTPVAWVQKSESYVQNLESYKEPAPLGPTPGLADIDRLAATALDAGVRVGRSRWVR
jgi:hypothetical protein